MTRALCFTAIAVFIAACSAEPQVSATPAPAAASVQTAAPRGESRTDQASPSAASATASPEGDALGPAELTVGDWVSTIVDGVRIREEPGTSATAFGMLRAGYTGTVIDGPTEVDGHEWVHVAWPGLPSGSGCATGTDGDGYLSYCGVSGWLATADPSGDEWLEQIEPDCPEAPTRIRDLAEIQPGLRLACFGSMELTLVGYLAAEVLGRGCYPGYTHSPEWLGPCQTVFLQGEESRFDATTWEVSVNVEPALGTCDYGGREPESCPFIPFFGSWVAVTGGLDHPDAEACVIDPMEGNATAPDAAMAVYLCRERFAVTSIAPATAP